MSNSIENLVHHTTLVITKYENEEFQRAGDPYEVIVHEGNAFAPRGTRMLWKLFSGQASGNEFYSGTNSYIFVGDSPAAVAGTGQPYDLQGANKAGAAVDAGFPTQVSYGSQSVAFNQIAYQATFGAGVASFLWAEMGLVNGSTIAMPGLLTDLPASGTLFNRAIAPDTAKGWGIKVAGVVWLATLLISVS